jgi:integrase
MFRGRAIMAKQHSIGAHSTRHTAAWNLYLKTGDINKVRKFLNHDNEKVTKLYLHNKRESA